MLRNKTRKKTIIPKITCMTGMIAILLVIRMSTNPPITINPIIEPREEDIVLINENTPNFPQFSVGPWVTDTNLSNANASFIGEAFSGTNMADLSGYSVAGAGDVNNDGYDDILIGAPASCNGEIDLQGAGQTFLILGRPTTDWQMDLDLSAANASFIGEDRSDNSGHSVAGAGDVNNDGFDDILIGAPGDDDGGNNAGQTYLILGRPTANWQMDLDLSAASASFIGEGSDPILGDHSGSSVAGAGDVNNDGYDDILIGASYNNESGTLAGQTYLILGRPTANWQMDLDLSAADASFIGELGGDHSGGSVAGAGDVNNDGYDDILIAAPGSGAVGQTYLILGRPTANWQMDLDLSAASASFIGEYLGDCSGYSVAGAGDVNKDGYDDILIGA
ncbi:MAG: integrin alpha, partial [Candidatus Odinarchaeota archaeon]